MHALSNYPPGAEHDPFAPYNEVEEEVIMAPVRLSGERKPTERAVRPLTYEEYLRAWPNAVTSPVLVLADGPKNRGVFMEVRWNGKPRTWKRSPGWVERPVKYGMYECLHVGLKDGSLKQAFTLVRDDE